MSIATRFETRIRENRLTTLPVDWQDEIIFPYYDGLSLRNIPHTIAALLGAPLPQSQPLPTEIWQMSDPTEQIDRVVLFLMDGMGYKHLRMLMEEDIELAQAVADLSGGREVLPLTSVAPSTTAVALTTLWTGGAPGATGLLGTTMFLREFSLIGDMLSFRPVAGKHLPDTFSSWGLSAEQVVPMPGLAQHLTQHNIASHLVLEYPLSGTGLSRILHRGIAHTHLHSGNSDLMLRVEDVLRQTHGQRCYVGIYWPAVDTIAHLYGAHNRYTHQEIRSQILALRDLLAKPEIGDGRTLFMLLADHGHYDAPNRINVIEDDHAQVIREALRIGVTGDNRLPQLHLRPGTVERVKAHIDNTYEDSLTYIERDAALACGFWGHETIVAQSAERLGDLLLIPRLGWTVQDPSVVNYPIVSWHAGLSDWEMMIPFLWKTL